MFITCKFPTVNIGGNTYTNRRINLANIVMMDKSNSYYTKSARFNTSGHTIEPSREISVPSIKFTSIISTTNGKGEIFEWLFESVADRDAVMDDIDLQLDYRINK